MITTERCEEEQNRSSYNLQPHTLATCWQNYKEKVLLNDIEGNTTHLSEDKMNIFK